MAGRHIVRGWLISSAALIVAGAATLTALATQPATMTLEPKTATVGDLLTLTLTAPGAAPQQVSWPTIDNRMVGTLTLLRADTIDRGRELKRLGGPTLRLTLAAFDTGSFSTGRLSVLVGGDSVTFEPHEVFITSVLDDSSGQQLRPLKAQEDLPITFSDLVRRFGPWIVAIGLAMLLWTLIRNWLRKRRRPLSEEEKELLRLSPYDEAMLTLDELEQNNPLARGDQKAYVSALAMIVKRLLERTHRDPVLEMTTYEVRRWTVTRRTLCSPNDVLRILEAGDLVKFARAALEKTLAESLLSTARAITATYEPREETNGETSEPNETDSVDSDAAGSELAGVASETTTHASWRMRTAKSGANRSRRSS